MYIMVINSGCTSTNAVIMDNERNIKAFYVIRIGARCGENAKRILTDVLKKAGLKKRGYCLVRSLPGTDG
ncbi:MAG: hypothetical protein V8R85_06770 [Frisingicoccus sp.]